MATLNAKQRAKTATVKVDGQDKFPMPDKAHAKSALARIDQAKPPLTPAQKAKVRAKAARILGTDKLTPGDTTDTGKTGRAHKFPLPKK